MITDINQLQLTQNSSSFKFFYTHNGQYYHITVTATCRNENEVNPYSDHIFYHQFEEVNYKITCCLISPKVIFEDFFGINYIDNYSSQALTFNKEILETELVSHIAQLFTQFLGLVIFFYLLYH